MFRLELVVERLGIRIIHSDERLARFQIVKGRKDWFVPLPGTRSLTSSVWLFPIPYAPPYAYSLHPNCRFASCDIMEGSQAGCQTNVISTDSGSGSRARMARSADSCR